MFFFLVNVECFKTKVPKILADFSCPQWSERLNYCTVVGARILGVRWRAGWLHGYMGTLGSQRDIFWYFADYSAASCPIWLIFLHTYPYSYIYTVKKTAYIGLKVQYQKITHNAPSVRGEGEQAYLSGPLSRPKQGRHRHANEKVWV